MRIEFLKEASLNIKEIYLYISQDSQSIARKFIFKLISYIYNLSLFPKMGKLIKQYNVRKLIYRNYIVLYQINYDSNTIYIIKIFNSKQDINIILKQIEKYID